MNDFMIESMLKVMIVLVNVFAAIRKNTVHKSVRKSMNKLIIGHKLQENVDITKTTLTYNKMYIKIYK
jgi:hypothetical protein